MKWLKIKWNTCSVVVSCLYFNDLVSCFCDSQIETSNIEPTCYQNSNEVPADWLNIKFLLKIPRRFSQFAFTMWSVDGRWKQGKFPTFGSMNINRFSSITRELLIELIWKGKPRKVSVRCKTEGRDKCFRFNLALKFFLRYAHL